MDVGTTKGWRLADVVPAAEIVRIMNRDTPLEPCQRNYRGEVASRYRYQDGQGEIGMIASVTRPFCGDCTRARLTADEKLYTCLFSAIGHDLRSLLRSGSSDADIARFVEQARQVSGCYVSNCQQTGVALCSKASAPFRSPARG